MRYCPEVREIFSGASIRQRSFPITDRYFSIPAHEAPAPVVITDPDPSSSYTESPPEVRVPTLQIQLSGFDWWVIDKDIEQCLSSVSSGLFQLDQLTAPDTQILDVVSRIFSEQFVKDDWSSRISARVMPTRTPKPLKSQGPLMLYEDPTSALSFGGVWSI
jgi:hypothetical protein